jgi:hypothetical protein
MPGQLPERQQAEPTLPAARRYRRAVPVILGVATIAAVGATAALALAPAAGAAPEPDYHPGRDTATFTVTGVLDSNCPVSAGGTEIWIKPGDEIDFTSALAGVDVGRALAGQPAGGGLGGVVGGVVGGLLTPSQVAGLDVRATLDPGTAQARPVHVTGGRTTTYPSGRQPPLAAGDHSIRWTATGLALAPSLGLPAIPLSAAALRSGASLTWSGVIHVSDSAARCRLGAGVPRIGVHAGPVQATLPPVGIGVGDPSKAVPGSGPRSSPGSGPAPVPGGYSTIDGDRTAGPTVAAPTATGGATGGGGHRSGLLGRRDGSGIGPGLDRNGSGGARPGSADPAAPAALTARQSGPADELSLVLVVIAVLALAGVTAGYARLYLLRRDPR